MKRVLSFVMCLVLVVCAFPMTASAGEKIVEVDSKYSYSDMEKDLEELVLAYPDILSYESLGTTYDDREIYEVIVGNPEAEKQLLIQASMHAREYINSLLAMRQIEELCSNYSNGEYNSNSYKDMLNSVCLRVIPMTNPDGVTISQVGPKGIRNERLRSKIENICKKYGNGKKLYYTRWKANARGVDLNRNYPLRWSQRVKVKHPASEGYGGDEPASEKETQIMMSHIKAIKPTALISYHSTGSVIYWNYLQSGQLQSDCRRLFEIANGFTGYRGIYAGTVKPSKCLGDWACAKQGIPTITIENGVGECPINIQEFSSIWKKNKELVPALLNFCYCPKAPYVSSASGKKGGAKITWSRVDADGYQVRYYQLGKSKKKIVNLEDNAKSCVIKDLKKGNGYKLSVRSYKLVDGKRVYSSWSEAKIVRAK